MGHLWLPLEGVVEQGGDLLQIPPLTIPAQIDTLVADARVTRESITDAEGDETTTLWLPRVHSAEERIAARLAHLLLSPPNRSLRLPPEQAAELIRRVGQAELTDEQGAAISSLLTGTRLAVITGGPGTGKTTTVRSLIACLESLSIPYALCATTGRASKQLAGSTGRPAATVHRHLKIGIGREIEAVVEPVLIIDESSMIDLWLLDEILSRLRDHTHVMLVGDVDQLPSVGPGAILQDLIEAGERARIPGISVTRLSQIFRQEAGERSMIVVNCHRVRRGERPLRDVRKTSDYFEMHRDTPLAARGLAVELASSRLPSFLDLPPSEVQVLAPMHGGDAGIRALNHALQEIVNPPSPGKTEVRLPTREGPDATRVLRVGDKVRQTRNDYQKRVFNGDLGVITRVEAKDRVVVVRYDSHSVTYAPDELDELVHAWAMTVHSAQGSQWPAIVLLMLTSHYVMLERNILYTGLSRAQRLAVLITQERAVRIAVSRDQSTRRRTNLVSRLRGIVAPAPSG